MEMDRFEAMSIVLAVAEAGSLSAAARHLHATTQRWQASIVRAFPSLMSRTTPHPRSRQERRRRWMARDLASDGDRRSYSTKI